MKFLSCFFAVIECPKNAECNGLFITVLKIESSTTNIVEQLELAIKKYFRNSSLICCLISVTTGRS